MVTKIQLLSIMFAATLCVFGGDSACAGTAFQNGVTQYNLGRWRLAIFYLDRAVTDQSDNVLAHYYLANALVHQGLHDQAVQEYQICYELNPGGALGKLAFKALVAYGQAPEVRSPAAQNNEIQVAHEMGACRAPVRQALDIIWRQAAYEKEKHHGMGENRARACQSLAEIDAGQIRDEAANEIQRTLNNPPLVPVGMGILGPLMMPDREAAKQKADEIRRNADEAEKKVRLLADNRAKDYRHWSKLQEIALDEVASNLESQLKDSDGNSRVKLQAVGTDLYTRYYGYDRLGNERDVQPTAVRVISPESAGQQEGSWGDAAHGSLKSIKSVQGKILHKNLD